MINGIKTLTLDNPIHITVTPETPCTCAPADADLSWRRSLKVGDEIAFEIMDVREWWQSFRVVERIERGRIYAGGFAFDIETGIERRRGKPAFRLVRPTAEGKRLSERHSLISAIRKVKLEDVPDDKLGAIAYLCGVAAPKAEGETPPTDPLAWRASLKPGDEIVIVQHEDGYETYDLDTVFSVTSEIITNGTDPWLTFTFSKETGLLLCNPNDPCPEGCTKCGELYSIREPTPEIREQIRLAELLKDVAPEWMTVDELKAFAAVAGVDISPLEN